MLTADRFPELIYLGPAIRPQTDLSMLGSLVRPLPRNARTAFRAVGLRGVPGWIYTIHLDRPLGTEKHQAWHYTGWTEDLAARMREHAAGQGARILEVAKERGIGWRVVAVYPGTKKIEAGIKKHAGSFRCTVCSGKPTPRVPRLSVQIAAELERRATQGRRPRAPAKRPQGPYTAGVHRGGEWAKEMRESGLTADQIEAAHRAEMAAAPAAKGAWETKHLSGYHDSVRSVITAMRRGERQLQPA